MEKDSSSIEASSSVGKVENTEAPADTPQQRNSLVNQQKRDLVSRPSPIPISQNRFMMVNDNAQGVNGIGTPVDPSLAAMIQRHQEEQKLIQTRLLMQQRQADDSILAAAMATASNNLMAAGVRYPPHVPQDPFLYQQALLQGQGGLPPSTGSPFGVPPLSTFSQSSPRPVSERSKGTKKKKKGKASKDGYAEFCASNKYEPYFDGSTVPDPGPDEDDSDADKDDSRDDSDRLQLPKSKQNEAFPKKLYRIIEEAKKNGQEDIISFFPHGRAFAIHKPQEFVSEIMPKYMSTTRLSSFQRQLNLYNFKRITEGRDKGGYYHEFFLQGRKNLTKRIKRKRPSVPKATREDLDTAARISNEILATGTYSMPFDPIQQQQQRLMMERGPLPQDINMGFGYGGPFMPPVNNLAVMRGQMYPNASLEVSADPNGLPYGAMPFGA